MFLYYLINIRKTKQNWLKKTLSHLAGLAHLRAGSHLGEPARLTGPAHLHMNSPSILKLSERGRKWKTQFFISNGRLKILEILKQQRNKSLTDKNLNGFSYNQLSIFFIRYCYKRLFSQIFDILSKSVLDYKMIGILSFPKFNNVFFLFSRLQVK